MSTTYIQANPAQRGLRRIAATRAGSWLFAHVLRRLDPLVYRLTCHRHTLANLISGLPVVILTTTGARTGRPRTVPVLGFPTTGGLAIIASNFGQRHQPGWYYNLRANPEASLTTMDGITRRVRAVEARGALRDSVWRQGLAIYPGWAAYQQRAQHRDIAIFILACPQVHPSPGPNPHSACPSCGPARSHEHPALSPADP